MSVGNIPEPRVRCEQRRAWIPKGGRPTMNKHAAYVRAAKQMLAAKCDCKVVGELTPLERADRLVLDDGRGWYNAEDLSEQIPCRFHTPTTRHNHEDGSPEGPYFPHYTKVKKRLIRFLKFSDARILQQTGEQR